MAIKRTKAEKKQAYDRKLCSLLDEYTKVLIALADNVGSKQLQDIRRGLRGDSVVLMGKNTLIRRCIKAYADKTGNHTFDPLMDLLVGNVGLIFTKGDLKEVREEVAKYKVGAPARVGLVAPVDVVVPPGNTGLDPSQTSFFQVLNIPTKINKGTVEIITPVELIKKGDKNVLAVAVETDYSYTHADKIKEYLKDPSKFAVAAPVATADSGAAAAPKEEEKKAEEPAEESDDDMGFSLFD
ncbi:hypothetical protein C2845_PM04G32960 [Panicum miliaceum]|uniref:Uncharacterized protein n=1 Tax=Panicum miliaceum TaxID=4540 RepID=A0A3L6QLE0_PANMI|nr:hypothetical protein C2845_PM04G32960 [Panicum miliaceum]